MVNIYRLWNTSGMKKISIVFPSFNEENNSFFWRGLKTCISNGNCEVILCDGGSTDQTLERASQYLSLKIVKSKKSGRSQQLEEGFKQAEGDLVILHHPRSILELKAIQYLQDNAHRLSWGGFTHQFDNDHPILKFTSWYSNEIRSKRKGIVYLDHCLYFRRDLIKKDQVFPEVEIFEDTIISHNLKKQLGPPLILPFVSLTSSIRFQKNGILYQSLLNQILKLAFHLNLSHQTMSKIYEKGLELNHRFHQK